MLRVQSYIDGFNLYHAVDDLHKSQVKQRLPSLNHLKWLNLRSLSEAFVKSSQESLQEVYYFTAYAKWLPRAMVRHRAYVEALEACGVTPVFGHFKEKQRNCKRCGAQWTGHEEKGTDTNLVIQLVQEAHQDRFDKAIIITADSDMVPAIHMVLNTFPHKQILVCTPPDRHKIARELRSTVQTQRMKLRHLTNNLLPQTVYRQDGSIAAIRPTEYNPSP